MDYKKKVLIQPNIFAFETQYTLENNKHKGVKEKRALFVALKCFYSG